MAKKTQEDGVYETRPKGETKDPLAEGVRLYNPSNTEGEKYYETDESEMRAEEEAKRLRKLGLSSKPAHPNSPEAYTPPTRPAHKARNKSEDELAEATKNRKGR